MKVCYTSDNLISIINQTLKIPITKDNFDENLQDFGMTSVSFIKLVVLLEEYFDINIPDESLIIDNFNTTKNIVNILRELDITIQ